MSDSVANSKRVAMNTLMLYVRMLVLMAISLFTSRVTLQALGVENYGINNVVTGFLSMFGILTTAMCTAVSRFITVELGKSNNQRLKEVFSTSLSVMIFLGIALCVILESFGIWFLESKLNIPADRALAANWVFHFAVINTIVYLFSVPYNSLMIAHERMKAFAYMTIFDAIMKLLVCFSLYISPVDKLISYAALNLFVSLISQFIYWYYSRSRFEEARYTYSFDKALFKDIWSFAGWNFLGQSSWILNNQGINMLMNIFFGVSINAARGIAVQVDAIVKRFVDSFMMAINPQITKSYAAGEKTTSYKLACRGARFSFFLMLVLAVPLLLESDQILSFWLGTPPIKSGIFVNLTIISSLIIALGNTLVTLQNANGKIKQYQIIMTICGLLPFPFSWVAFKYGLNVEYSYYIYICVYYVLLFVRCMLVHKNTGIPYEMYIYGVLGRCHLVAIATIAVPLIIRLNMSEGFARLAIVIFISLINCVLMVYILGLETNERTVINAKVKQIIIKSCRR